MNGSAAFDDESGRRSGVGAAQGAGFQAAFAQVAIEKDSGMSGMTAFWVAVGGASMICYWLMTRMQNRGSRRQNSTGGNSDSGSYDSGSGGWNIASWFSSDNSSSESSSSGSWSDSGGSDSGGGGD
jgi:hypothetical protein